MSEARQPVDLDAGRVRAELLARRAGFDAPVDVVALTRSTNDDLKAAAAAGAQPLTVLIAEAQSAGRGRAGRSWHSPPGENLHLSFLLRPDWEAALAAPFALVVGLAVAEEVELRIAPALAQVKWPNDVLVAGRKLGGILLEATVQRGRLATLVVGVGLDVRSQRFPGALADRATSLALLGAADLDRSRLAAGIVARTAAHAERFGREGLTPFLQALAVRDPLRGAEVLTEGRRGIGRGLAPDGRLLIELEDGTLETLSAGDVELTPERR